MLVGALTALYLGSMMDSPDMQEVMQVQARMALEQTHGEFVRGVDLDPDARDAFKDLLAERQMSMMSIGLNMWKEGKTPEGDASPKEIIDAFNEQIHETLGDENYALFERFEETQPERMQVDMFRERLRGDQELDWETQDRLIEAMANARLNAPKNPEFEALQSGSTMPNAEMMSEVVAHMEGISQLYLDEAAAILNPEQFTAFEESVEQYAVMQKAGVKMAEAMFGKSEEAADQE